MPKITWPHQHRGCWWISLVNTWRPRQNGRHFPDDIFKCIFFNENVWIVIKISLKFVPKGPINDISALVQIMAWRRSLPEPMLVSLLTHICTTLPDWVNSLCVKSFGRHVFMNMHFDGLVQDCSNSSALAVGLLQSCTKPSIYTFYTRPWHWNCTGWRYTPSSMTSNILNSLSSGDMELGQHWLRWWLVAWRYQAITWANVDLSSVRSLGIHLRSLSLDDVKNQSIKQDWKLHF